MLCWLNVLPVIEYHIGLSPQVIWYCPFEEKELSSRCTLAKSDVMCTHICMYCVAEVRQKYSLHTFWKPVM